MKASLNKKKKVSGSQTYVPVKAALCALQTRVIYSSHYSLECAERSANQRSGPGLIDQSANRAGFDAPLKRAEAKLKAPLLSAIYLISNQEIFQSSPHVMAHNGLRFRACQV